MNAYFNVQASSVKTSRILYTSSSFARSSLLYLQEIGTLKAIHPHSSTRKNLQSYLFFIVLDGKGKLNYKNKEYELKKGDCVFIDCKNNYSHSTQNELWSLEWCHFYSSSLPSIYEKYLERGGKNVFHPKDESVFSNLLNELYGIADSKDYIRDMRINEKLNSLLTLIMEESWHPENKQLISRKKRELDDIREYLDKHYTEHILLEDLEKKFYINKYYLSKIFKETYGITINNYLVSKKITKAKQLLRFTDKTISEIGEEIGIQDTNYFCRMFKKVEGMSPNTYKKKW